MLDYDKLESKQLEKNILEFRKSILRNIDSKSKIKIENFASKFNLEYEYVLERIYSDDLFILHFIKEPQKQSFHQKEALKYLSKIKNVQNAQQLDSTGDNALYVINGQVTKGKHVTSNQPGKSIDFEWEYINKNGVIIKCYATHKHTKEEGGSQNNQFTDVKTFFENSAKFLQKSNLPECYFYAICDGKFYQKNYLGSNSKIDYLNNTYKTNSTRIHATTINDLENHMITI